jgi:hypothetical protein
MPISNKKYNDFNCLVNAFHLGRDIHISNISKDES